MPILRTATGKEYPCDFMGVAGEAALYVKVAINLNEILEVFQNPEETIVLQWIGIDNNIVREEHGFTRFTGFSLMKGDCPVRIRLGREFANSK